jgi:hypothetical protein
MSGCRFSGGSPLLDEDASISTSLIYSRNSQGGLLSESLAANEGRLAELLKSPLIGGFCIGSL